MLWCNGKIVPDDIPTAWRLLDNARFHLLKQAAAGEPPSSTLLYGNPALLQAYQFLSIAASQVWSEHLRGGGGK